MTDTRAADTARPSIAANDSSFIHHAGPDDPPFLFHCGESFQTHRLPTGTRVIYPRPPLPGIADTRGAVAHAIDHPLGCEPLSAHLSSGMTVTIAFDDISLPLPRMRRPDIRQTIIESVMERLDAAGITDIHLICAICLHRRVTPAELKRMVGPRVFRRFWPDRLYNHDAEDPNGNTLLGETGHGEIVEINRRAAESDLLIYVNINLVTMDGGHKSVPVGLATYRSVRAHHNVQTLMTSRSYMDPATSSFHRSCDRMGEIVAQHVNLFTIETTLNSDTFAHMLGFLQKRESQWTAYDRLNRRVNNAVLGLLPPPIRRKVYHGLPAPYGLTGVHAGRTGPVHEKTLDAVHRQQCIQINGQADIVLVGLPSIGPYSVDSILNPILVYCMAAGYFFNFYRGKPLVRKGGVMIVVHPLEYKFHSVHHPSYADFFEEVLPETRVPAEIEQRFEKRYAENERYIHLYRTTYAYHGVHPMYMWYWGCHGMDHLGRVIAVAPRSEPAASRIGFHTAPSLNRAIEQARDFLGMPGDQAQITYFHCPPILMCDVT
ncbi:MAG: DUF2088 domain-containing protein [Phycisphaerales bacterium]|nr:DUF2088 domain-containing protein [Phycisphaerales bacterium]